MILRPEDALAIVFDRADHYGRVARIIGERWQIGGQESIRRDEIARYVADRLGVALSWRVRRDVREVMVYMGARAYNRDNVRYYRGVKPK